MPLSRNGVGARPKNTQLTCKPHHFKFSLAIYHHHDDLIPEKNVTRFGGIVYMSCYILVREWYMNQETFLNLFPCPVK